ncbi:DUF4190 domain-containing protein [Cellulosimicrobium protaetiae]|uniref:DUF4190 domain-containing protein n=1 Tax=Cellulosimicrobium protaetiae TaxID=2587808 RepID=UPI0012B6C5AA|nr:DUF4190 domain-containing protein [Cellulosimicrobium protaetiae]
MSTPDQPDQNPQPGATPSGPPAYGAPQPGQPQQPPQAPQYGAPQAPQYGAPQAPQYNAPQGGTPGYSAPAQDPGKTMGIVGLVLSFLGCLSIVGLILSIVAFNKSKKAGYKNNLALAGIIVGAIVLVISIVVGIILGIGTAALVEKCSELGPGTHFEDGVTYTCS